MHQQTVSESVTVPRQTANVGFYTANRFGIDFTTAFLPYGPEWRTHRRMFHQAMKLETVELYQNLYRSKAMKLNQSLLDTPDDFENHIQL
jgi:hypothetical protein